LFVHEDIDTPREPGSVQTRELMKELIKEHTTTGWNSIVSLTTRFEGKPMSDVNAS